MTVPRIVLNNGTEIPQLGFGVWRVPHDATHAAVSAALKAGYRHIDTAKLYANEDAVGAAIRDSGLAREAVFVTTKVWNDDQGYDATLRAFDASMRGLGFDVLDLYLIHWPVAGRGLAGETWRAMERLHLDGRVRAIGVSNFKPDHLSALLNTAQVVPAINQVELHPYLQQHDTRAVNAEHGIATEAWSPLARGGVLLTDPVIGGIAAKHDRTPAQVVLRWHLQLGTVAIPKSVTPARIEENFDVFGFDLDEEEMAAVAALDRGERTGPDPDRIS
ncbi:MAG: aldo/keto reductase [Nocardioidaceae bacterium]